MSATATTFGYSRHEEEFPEEHGFDSREEAVAAALADDDFEPGEFVTCEVVPQSWERVCERVSGVVDFSDRFDDVLYDDFGEEAPDRFDPSEDDLKELRDEVSAVLLKWSVRHSLCVPWSLMERVQRHVKVAP